MYEAYKKGKLGQKLDGDTSVHMDTRMDIDPRESSQADLEIEEFMKNNEL